VSLLFLAEKNCRLFYSSPSATAVSPLSPKKTDDICCSSLPLLLISLGYHPLEGVTTHLFYLSDLVCLLFFVNLPTIFPFWCHLLEDVTRGGPPFPTSPPSAPIVTPLTVRTGARFITAVWTVTTSVTPARYVNTESRQVAAELVRRALYNACTTPRTYPSLFITFVSNAIDSLLQISQKSFSPDARCNGKTHLA